ncbi:MAG: cation:proton antiporter [Saprospiraceae bacterium]|nr:cation:proton antiporter [Saprospiraceae bacterium]
MLVLIVICISLLLAYVVEISSRTTKVPSVLFLLALGYCLNQICLGFNILMPNMEAILPGLGTVGLILIVLEGSLELELKKEKFQFIKKSLVSAIVPMIISMVLISVVFVYATKEDLLKCILNSIPLCVISSAIAIPASKFLNKPDKEFVIYESSLSDILGVLFFNFFLINQWLTLRVLAGLRHRSSLSL